MKNKYGFISIELGGFIIPEDNDITNLIPKETKELLFNLANEINQVGEHNIGLNVITKIPLIHFVNYEDLYDIHAIGTILTDDNGLYNLIFSFNHDNICHLLEISANTITLTKHEL